MYYLFTKMKRLDLLSWCTMLSTVSSPFILGEHFKLFLIMRDALPEYANKVVNESLKNVIIK